MRFAEWFESNIAGNVGVGVLPIAQDTGRLLIGQRSNAVASPNTWSTWGGRAEKGNLQAEVKREFEEETGYMGSLRLIPSYIFNNGVYVYHNFIGLVPHEFDPDLNWETQAFRWVTYKQLMAMSGKHPGLMEFLGNAVEQIKSQCRQGDSNPPDSTILSRGASAS